MKIRTWVTIGAIVFISFSIWMNYKLGTFNNLPAVGISMHYKSNDNEKIEHPISKTSLKHYKDLCQIASSNTFITHSIKGKDYQIFISISNESPLMVEKLTNNSDLIIRKKNNTDTYKSPIFIYKKDSIYIHRHIEKEFATSSLIIFDVTSKDSCFINSIFQNNDFVNSRLIPN